MDGRDTLGILPTGGGKSLTFQVPGLMKPGMTIVVTPLISLMKDQVDNLRSKRIKAVFLHSGMSVRERREATERIFNDKAKFLYISPERIGNDLFLQEIKRLRISQIVVDEAHCISQWGYDFRPSYLKIKRLRKTFPDVPLLALTASATSIVADDIRTQLEFRSGCRQFRGSVARDNLSYIVRTSEGKLYDIHNILSKVDGSAIVYVRSRKRTREISEYLNNAGISSSYYHAGLESREKEERQTLWKEGTIRVIVATNAFGMGIDKPDVRCVIHYDMPPSLEEYYQEAGRAGRDGMKAYAVLLTSNSDKAVLRRRLTMEFPPKEVIKQIYTRLCVFSHLEIGEGYDKSVEFDLLKFCRTFNMEEATVRPSLRILGQAGYAEFIEEYENSSRLIITVGRDELYKIKSSSPAHEKVLTAILRTYPGLFVDYVFINENKLSYLTQINVREIYGILVDLSKSKILNYIPRRKTSLIYFPTSMEEEKYIVIGKKVYEDRKEILSRRIESMIEYGFTQEDCRLKKIMKYFGEEDLRACGHCDICIENKKKKIPEVKESLISHHLEILLSEDGSEISNETIKSYFGKASEKALSLLRTLQREGIVKYDGYRWMANR